MKTVETAFQKYKHTIEKCIKNIYLKPTSIVKIWHAKNTSATLRNSLNKHYQLDGTTVSQSLLNAWCVAEASETSRH